jgi:hypothetical protein
MTHDPLCPAARAHVLEREGETPLEQYSRPDDRGKSQGLLVPWIAVIAFVALMSVVGAIEGM